MLHQGIILRSYVPLKQMFSIFDFQLGRIDGIIKNKQKSRKFFSGAYIYYAIDQWRDQYTISDIELIKTPADWAKKDLLFLHHIFEICYSFSPLHNQSKEVFKLFELLYQDEIAFDTINSKKIYICDLFKRMGIYSPNTQNYDISFRKFILSPLQNVYDIDLDKKTEQNLHKWLLECLQDNSGHVGLKTLNFLKN